MVDDEETDECVSFFIGVVRCFIDPRRSVDEVDLASVDHTDAFGQSERFEVLTDVEMLYSAGPRHVGRVLLQEDPQYSISPMSD